MARLTRAVDEVLQALTEPGRAPAYHHRQVKRLAEEWAPLYYALNRLQDTRRAHTAPEHEQAATAALEWLHRQSDRLGTIATRHGLDPFDYGYLYAVDATAHMLGQLLHATRLYPGAPISQHPGVHDDADRHRARAKARAEREAHPERAGHPSAEVDHHPQAHTHEAPSAPPAPEDEPVPWLVTVTAWGDPEQQRVAELMADDQWQFIGSDFLWAADDLTFITPLLRADRMHTEEDYRLTPWESVGGRYEPRRYTRHVTDWTADTEEHDHE